MSVHFRRARASEIRSSIGRSVSSPKTGEQPRELRVPETLQPAGSGGAVVRADRILERQDQAATLNERASLGGRVSGTGRPDRTPLRNPGTRSTAVAACSHDRR
jgi:hypothetical protein